MRRPSINALRLLFIESQEDADFDPSDNTGFVKHNGVVYNYEGNDQGLGAFYDESGMRVSGSLAQELAAKIAPVKSSKQMKFVPKASSPKMPGNIGGVNVPPWWNDYNDAFDDLENQGKFTALPQSLHGIFKNPTKNYRQLADGRDFVTIFPTPASIKVDGRSNHRGVYVLRSVAHQDIPDFGISAGDSYEEYVPKIAETLGTNNLKPIRDEIVANGLGKFFRRDGRIETVTKWIPDPSFGSYDELAQYTDQIIENDISRCCKAINEALRRLIRIG